MTDIDSMIAVLMAAKDGKTIQVKVSDEWQEVLTPVWNFGTTQYRAKPEPRVIQLTAKIDGNGWSVTGFGEYKKNLELEFIDGKLVGAKVL